MIIPTSLFHKLCIIGFSSLAILSCQGNGDIQNPLRPLKFIAHKANQPESKNINFQINEPIKLNLMAINQNNEEFLLQPAYSLVKPDKGNIDKKDILTGSQPGEIHILAKIGPYEELFKLNLFNNEQDLNLEDPLLRSSPVDAGGQNGGKSDSSQGGETPPNTPSTTEDKKSNQSLTLSMIPGTIRLNSIGDSGQFNLQLKNESGTLLDLSSFNVQWSSSKPAISVDQNGKVTSISNGFSTIIASIAEQSLSARGEVIMSSGSSPIITSTPTPIPTPTPTPDPNQIRGRVGNS